MRLERYETSQYLAGKGIHTAQPRLVIDAVEITEIENLQTADTD